MKEKKTIFNEERIQEYKSGFKTKTLKEVVDPHLTYNRFQVPASAIPHTFLVSKPDQMIPIWSLLAASLECVPILHIDAESKIPTGNLALVIVTTPFLDTVIINTLPLTKREKGIVTTDWDAVMEFFPREFRERMFFDKEITFIGSGIGNEEGLFKKLTDDLPKEKVNLFLEDIPLSLLQPKSDTRSAFLYCATSNMNKAAFDLSPKSGIGFIFTSLQNGYFKPLKKDSWKSPITWRFYQWNNMKFDYRSQQVSYCWTDGIYLPLCFLSCGYFLYGNTPLVECFSDLKSGRFMNELGALVRLCSAHFLNLPVKAVAEIFKHGTGNLDATNLSDDMKYELRWVCSKNGLVIEPRRFVEPAMDHPLFVNQSPIKVNLSHSATCDKSEFPGLEPTMNFSALMEVVETCRCGCRLTSFTGSLEDPERDSMGRPVPQFNVDISWRSTSLLDTARDKLRMEDFAFKAAGIETRSQRREVEDLLENMGQLQASDKEIADFWDIHCPKEPPIEDKGVKNCEPLDEWNLSPLMKEYREQWIKCIHRPNAVSRLFVRPEESFIPDLEKNWKIFSSVLKLRHRFYFSQLVEPSVEEKEMVQIFHEMPVGERNLTTVVVACRNLSSTELKCRMATKCLELGSGLTVDTIYFLSEEEGKTRPVVKNYSYRGSNSAIWENIFMKARFPSIRGVCPPMPNYCALEYCPVRSAHLSVDCDLVKNFCIDCCLYGHSPIQHNQRAFLEFMADGNERTLFDAWPRHETMSKERAMTFQPKMAYFRVMKRLKAVRGKTILSEFDVRFEENADLLAFKRVLKGYYEMLSEVRLMTGLFDSKSRFLGYFPEPKKDFKWDWLDKVPLFMQCQSRTWVRHTNLQFTQGLVFKWSPALRTYLTSAYYD